MDDCWDLDNIELIGDEDDCLQFIKMIYIDPYLHKYTKIFTYIILLFHVPLWIVQFYYYLKTFDFHLVVQYGPASLVFLFIFVSMVIPLLMENDIKYAIDTQKQFFWAIRVGGSEVQKNILRRAKYFVYITKMNIVLSVMTYISVLMRARAGLKWELLYQITFFKEKFPEYSDVLICVFYASMLPFLIPMTWMVFVLSYVALHTTFQAMMANERVGKITEKFPNNVELAHNETYQKQVSKRLGFCVLRLGALKSYAETNLDRLAPALVTYYILAFLLLVCYIGTWYLDPDMYYPLLFMIVIVSCVTALIVIELGQIIEDESMDSFTCLTALPWYTFNIINQKDLLLMLLFAIKPITASPYETFPLNRRMIVQFYKVFTTMSTFIANTRKKMSN